MNSACNGALIAGLLALGLLPAQADTIYLKNGVRFDGVVTPVPNQEGVFKVSAGDRQLIYRESEIDRIEKNDRTGHLDKEALMARWEERNRILTEETGLTADQRRQVRGLVMELRTEDGSRRIAIRESLIALQQEYDAYGFIASFYGDLSPLLAPNVLEAMAYMDSVRSIALLQESAQSNYFGARAMALELLGRLRHTDSIPIIARGLADYNQQVQISAAYALAGMGVREATPALISLVPHADLRVSGAARESLAALWEGGLPGKRPVTVSEWDAFWKSKTISGSPIQLAQLEPLSPEEEELTHTYDTN